ncbi:hypothetical protein [Flavobacterium channae]|uniref:hypothetical protein n=1 Tax=Flavobacterium channae TaxID=2897181 RepID=UPI001E55BD9B|nr:hypothetical protein [Flavobacterium channae]UGS23099.1 hypothetical protein LOS89_10035 [Flavobacterium channae]
MKKIITAFVLFVGFSSTVNAQEIKAKNTQEKLQLTEQKVDFNELAKKDAKDLNQLLQLDQQKNKDFYGLFLYKHEEMSKVKETSDKEKISTIIEAKLRASLTTSQMEKLASQPKLLHQLTH